MRRVSRSRVIGVLVLAGISPAMTLVPPLPAPVWVVPGKARTSVR